MNRVNEQMLWQQSFICQQAYAKMSSISNYQGNVNKNHNELSPDICQKGDYQKVKK